MDIIIISGRSGAGKSVALRALEDMGYYCVDNIPFDLLPQLTQILHQSQLQGTDLEQKVGVNAENHYIDESTYCDPPLRK